MAGSTPLSALRVASARGATPWLSAGFGEEQHCGLAAARVKAAAKRFASSSFTSRVTCVTIAFKAEARADALVDTLVDPSSRSDDRRS